MELYYMEPVFHDDLPLARTLQFLEMYPYLRALGYYFSCKDRPHFLTNEWELMSNFAHDNVEWHRVREGEPL